MAIWTHARRRAAQAGPGGCVVDFIRAWLTPIRFNGDPVYVAQAGRPVGGRFAHHDTADDTLHDDVDEARNFLIQDMMYSGGLDKLGFVYGVGPSPQAQPRTTLNGAPYHTDGLRAVMFFATRPLSFANVEMLQVGAIPRAARVLREPGGWRCRQVRRSVSNEAARCAGALCIGGHGAGTACTARRWRSFLR